MAKSLPPKQREVQRLDAAAWTDAALDALGKGGIDSVRVELLAKQLNVTKGSFYWHFKDRNALYEAMLKRWKRRATLALIERLDRAISTPEQRLRELLKLPLVGKKSERGAEVELAIRLWGRRDPRAEAALSEVDQLRLDYLTNLLSQCGVGSQEAEARAILAYSYMRVAATLMRHGDREAMTACENVLLGVPNKAS